MTEQKAIIKIPLQSAAEGQALFGPQDVFLKLVEQRIEVQVVSRESEITVRGGERETQMVGQLFEVLLELIRNGYILTERDVLYAIDLALELRADQLLDLYKGEIAVTFRGKPIRVKTIGQKHYVTTIKKRDIVFGVGPAGTGKTYLAVVLAIAALKEGSVKRIILTRPAVEAGESLGFLPGDLQEKVDPYLRPLYDALYDVMGPDQVGKALERGLIEIAPLAYMRGRTLDDSFIILDEAQNTTPEQMKMFLTRLGFGSKMVITGDVTQIDLPRGKKSGLIEAKTILQNIEEIGFVHFTESDVVRHSLVQKIIVAYEEAADQN
ncbi:phosphate starvation-inducible protein PhoH [Paenibacillus sp. CAA11]|uniref:PhoH family protein n=1 Tax=Paenibacillus sp. CAA11 TaxID=1532905 RepID=UPI000D366C7D|nr:PhoH family protein [Paenibacillus sp. CAA11]AWB45406.1 phosphate starvation-inducible protein PhoH [Paenibacillus sp. CAA11]